jgi:hypothetical protein
MSASKYRFNEQIFIKGFTGPELEILAEQLRYSMTGTQEIVRGRTHLTSYGVVLLKKVQFIERLITSITTGTAPGYTVNIPVSVDDIQFTLNFFQVEHHRSRLGVSYVTREAFDLPTKKRLLRILDIELRFFSQAIQALCRLPHHSPLPPMATFQEMTTGVQAGQK